MFGDQTWQTPIFALKTERNSGTRSLKRVNDEQTLWTTDRAKTA